MERKNVRFRPKAKQRKEPTPEEVVEVPKGRPHGFYSAKTRTNEIIWHKKEAIHAVDFLPYKHHVPQKTINYHAATDGVRKIARVRAQGADKCGFRMASGGVDTMVRVWIISHRRDGDIDIKHTATLSRHEKGIGAVRFSPVTKNGKTILASAADDSYILIWVHHPGAKPTVVFGADPDEDMGSECWKCETTLRGHIEDVVDLSWSSDGRKLASCGIDNSMIIWDPWNKTKIAQLTNHTHYVQGCAIDPLGKLFATLSADRSMRCWVDRKKKTKKKDRFVSKAAVSRVIPTKEHDRPVRIFADDNLAGFVRRLQWCPTGLLLACPGAEIPHKSEGSKKGRKSKNDDTQKPEAMEMDASEPNLQKANKEETKSALTVASSSSGESGRKSKGPPRKTCIAIFTRRSLKTPMFLLASPEPVLAVRWCPTLYAPKLDKDGYEMETILKMPYRMILAAICENSVVLYDTHDMRPIARIVDNHYANMTDASWSNCGTHLMVSSRDGYISSVYLDQKKMGPILSDSPSQMRQKIGKIINRRVKLEAFVKKRRAEKKKEAILAAKAAEKEARKQARDAERAAAKLEKQKEKEAKKQAASIAAAFKKAEKKKLASKAKEDPVQKLTTGIQKAKIGDSGKSKENISAPKITKAAALPVVNQLVAKSKKKTPSSKAAPLATKAVSNANAKVPPAEKVNTLIPKKKNDKKRKSTFEDDQAESVEKKRKVLDTAMLTEKLEKLSESKEKSPGGAAQPASSSAAIIIDEDVEMALPKPEGLPKPGIFPKASSKKSSKTSQSSSTSKSSSNEEVPTMTTPTNKVVKIAPIFLLSAKKKTPSSSSVASRSSSGGSVKSLKSSDGKVKKKTATPMRTKKTGPKLHLASKQKSVVQYASPLSSANTTPAASPGPSSRSASPGPGPSRNIFPPAAKTAGKTDLMAKSVSDTLVADAKPAKKIKKKVKLTTISSNPSI